MNSFCKEKGIDNIDFLKRDVEGFELEVFQGAKTLLKENKIGLIAFELSHALLESLYKSQKNIIDFLNLYSYKIKHLDGELFKNNDLVGYSHLDLIAEL